MLWFYFLFFYQFWSNLHFKKQVKATRENILVRNSNNLPGCFGSLKPEIVQSTEYKATYPASNVLILGEEDVFFDHLTNGTSNLWLAEDKSTSGYQSSIKHCQRHNRPEG